MTINIDGMSVSIITRVVAVAYMRFSR